MYQTAVKEIAAVPAQNIVLYDLSIAMSVADLQQGATVVLEEDTNGNLNIRQVSPTKAFALRYLIRIRPFTCANRKARKAA